MSAYDDLLAERYDNRWWRTPAAVHDDNFRRRLLSDAPREPVSDMDILSRRRRLAECVAEAEGLRDVREVSA